MKHVNLFFDTDKIVLLDNSQCIYSRKDYMNYVEKRRLLIDSYSFDLSLQDHDLLLVSFNLNTQSTCVEC